MTPDREDLGVARGKNVFESGTAVTRTPFGSGSGSGSGPATHSAWWSRMRPWRDAAKSLRPRNDDTPPVPKTAFVLAGGGSRGAVQVGMLAELVERGVRAD